MGEAIIYFIKWSKNGEWKMTKSSDNRVLALREVIAKKTKELDNAPSAKYKSNLQYGSKNILVLSYQDIRAAIAELLVKQNMNTQVNDLLGHDEAFTQQDILDDLVLRGKILAYNKKADELATFQKKLDALRSEDLRIADELDDLESLLS